MEIAPSKGQMLAVIDGFSEGVGNMVSSMKAGSPCGGSLLVACAAEGIEAKRRHTEGLGMPPMFVQLRKLLGAAKAARNAAVDQRC